MEKGRYITCLDGVRRWCDRIDNATYGYWEPDEMYGRVQVLIRAENVRDGSERWGTPVTIGGAA